MAKDKKIELSKEDEEWLDAYRETAKKLHEKDKLAMVSRWVYHSAYREEDDEKIHVRYICPYCGHKEEIYDELGWPYKVKCPECRRIVWKSKLRKKPGRKKKKK